MKFARGRESIVDKERPGDDRCRDCRGWCFRTVRPARVNFRHCSSHRYFTSFSAQNRPQSSQVSVGVCSMGAKTAKAGTTGHTNDDNLQR